MNIGNCVKPVGFACVRDQRGQLIFEFNHTSVTTISIALSPALLLFNTPLLFILFFPSFHLDRLPSPSPFLSLSLLLPLLLTNFLSFSLSLSCIAASWHYARECCYQLVDWGLITWRREKRKKGARQTEKGRGGGLEERHTFE